MTDYWRRNSHKMIPAGITLLVCLVAFSSYEYFWAHPQQVALEEEVDRLNEALTARGAENNDLRMENQDQQAVIASFQGQIENIGNTVGNLEKLKNTDEELLQKYSKVYFLNENYTPDKLSDIKAEYLFNKDKQTLIHSNVTPYLKRLMDDARREGLDLLVASAFRSFDTQASLKSAYSVTYGTGANQFSADQGYSEHQLGTTVDFTTPEAGAVFSKFKDTPAYPWLLAHAYEYGFVISYPENNSYYIYEPWHWRFVGLKLAQRLHNEGEHFYDLDQRTIDNYLINIFD